MGKHKFINKKNAATLQLVNNPDEKAGSTFFQRVDKPNQTEKQVFMSDLIEKQLNKGKIKQLRKPDEFPKFEDPHALVDGRDDLWINQLKKQKQQQLHPDVKVKQFDEDGLPIDGYNYQQHMAKDDEDGEVVCQFMVPFEQRAQQVMDVDYNPEEMTPEQLEVYEALMREDGEYEEFEDDFVIQAQGGEQCYIDAKQQQKDIKQQIQLAKKSVKFQEEVEDEDDYEDEDEITYEKPSNKQPIKQAIKQSQPTTKQQYNSDDYSSGDEIDVDSDAEAEFEREMRMFNNGEECVDDDMVHNPETIGMENLNKILDDHLEVMQKKNQIPTKKHHDPQVEEQKRQLYLKELKKKDNAAYLREMYPNVDPAELKYKQDVAPLNPSEDVALQSYLARDTTDEDCPELKEAEHDDEDILIKQVRETNMSKINPDQLNIIRYKQKKASAPKADKEKYKQLKQEREQQQDNEHQQLSNLVLQKEATPEEKQLRKQMIKDIKKAQREKKQAFKSTLKNLAKHHQNAKNMNKVTNFDDGVSVMKIQ